MALFPQFPYANLHELNLDWLIENISQLVEDGTVISVNGMSGRVTLYTEKDVELPPRAFDANWSVYRRIADKMAGIQFTGEKFFYITKNVGDEDFTIQEVFTSANPPPYPVTSVNGRIGTVIIAGDNTPYNMDGIDTIEDVVSNIQKAIGPVVQYTSCSVGVTAGQYVYLFMSGISGRTDGIYKAANNKSANTAWTSADLIPVSAGIGGVLANDENSITSLNINKLQTYTMATAAEMPTISELTNFLTGSASPTGTFVIKCTNSGHDGSALLFCASTTNYGAGILISYSSDNYYVVKNFGGTVTIELLALKNEFTWKTLSSEATTGTIPSAAVEAICYVFKSGTSNIIPVTIDIGKTGFYRSGQLITSELSFGATIEYNASTRVVTLSQLYINGVNETADAKMKITYR